MMLCVCVCVCVCKTYLITDTWNPGLEITTLEAFPSIILGSDLQTWRKHQGFCLGWLSWWISFGSWLSVE